MPDPDSDSCLIPNADQGKTFFLCKGVYQVLTLIQTFLGPNFSKLQLVYFMSECYQLLITRIFNKALTAFAFTAKRAFIYINIF
jgi:hypothetical protein